MPRWPGCALVMALVSSAGPASATYSIVAADRTAGQVGGTGTSCLNGSDVYIIYGAAPGFGAVHAQAQANQNGRDRAVELLAMGMAPQAILDAITAPGFDPNAATRQYGIVDVTGRSAGFTGAGTRAFADDRQGTLGSFSYSVQGNILTSEAVLSQAAAAFEASGCDLAERLMRALEAGAENGEGDSRCTPDGIPSDSSFIQVEETGTPKGSYLELHVRSSGSLSPIPPLRSAFDGWRSSHPCPAAPTGGMGGMSGMSGTTGRSGGAGGSAGLAGGGAGVGGSVAAGVSGTMMEPQGSKADSDGGCGCRLGQRPERAKALILGLFLLLGLRRGSPARSRP